MELHDTRDQFVVDLERGRQLEHEAIGGQPQNEVVEQHFAADVDVRDMPGERTAHIALHQAADDASRHLLRGIARAARQCIGVGRLACIVHRLLRPAAMPQPAP